MFGADRRPFGAGGLFGCMRIRYGLLYMVGTFGTESAVRKRGGGRKLPYLNAKPRQIPLLVMQRMNSNGYGKISGKYYGVF